MSSRIKSFLLGLSILILASSCGDSLQQRKEGDIQFIRFERIFMDTPFSHLKDQLSRLRSDFPSPLLTIAPDDSAYLALIANYRNDSVINALYRAVNSRFPKLDPLERQLTDALERANNLDNEIVFNHFATAICSQGYSSRVSADRENKSLLIAIDQYVVPQMECFGFFGDPQYIVHLSDSIFILSDCMAAIANEFIAEPANEPSLLDLMMAEGKKLYFLELTLPHTPDSVRLRYTDQQYRWMKDNEKQVWSYLIQNKLLYETNYFQYHNLIDEAPKTNAFGDDSAPRSVAFIGWQIVRKYAKKNNITLKDLFAETDSQKILSQSHYRP